MTRLLIVFQDLPVFSEVIECYGRAAARLGSVSIAVSDEWSADRREWADPENIILFWGGHPSIPPGRRARCALRYTESSGAPDGLIPNQRVELEWLEANGRAFDIVFVGTPAVKAAVESHCKRTVAVPIGYDAGAMGIPDWDAKKVRDFTFYGSLMGRRQWIIPLLKKTFGSRISIVHKFGRIRQKALNCARTILYVGHSVEPGFPGMRLWQAIATSAALVTEDRDAWPAVPWRHYIPIPNAREEAPGEFIASMENALHNDLGAIAKRAHEELSTYTVDRCIADITREFAA